ncbi:MAG: AAA family ATPase [Desulfobacteraceae bacterium]|jgi:ATP-dependent metalloprotease FtsH
MFTEKAQALIDLAKDSAFAHLKKELDLEALLTAVGAHVEAGVRLAACLTNGDTAAVRAGCPDFGPPARCPDKMDLADDFADIVTTAAVFASADGVPDSTHPGLIDLRHLICALAVSPKACTALDIPTPMTRKEALRTLSNWYAGDDHTGSLSALIDRLRGLRTELMGRIFGQDHAIHTFVEGLYNAEVTAAAETERQRPSAVFVFAGPPGVGKTFLSELAAGHLQRPFKRFDMTGYTDHHAMNTLVGFAPSYKGSQPGMLTAFVDQNPDAILLFDEIEKAHLTTIQLFYQILDAGRLEDKHTEKEVSFRDTLIIFTTNAGRSLYDHPNKAGIHSAKTRYHKRTILGALESEKNPANGQPAFPAPICSRLAQGYPVMFNHLGINELMRVCRAALDHSGMLLERQYFKQITYDELLPICLVFREGGSVDARQLKAEAEKFFKSELFNYCSLHKADNLHEVFEQIERIHFTVEGGRQGLMQEVLELLTTDERPRILLVANDHFIDQCENLIPEIDWLAAGSLSEVMDILAGREVDMVLLDIWIQRGMENPTGDETLPPLDYPPKTGSDTILDVDFVPLTAKALDEGRRILNGLHRRFPHIPAFLLSFSYGGEMQGRESFHGIRFMKEDGRRTVDDELFLACVRAGGARGVVTTAFLGQGTPDWEMQRGQFVNQLLKIHRRLYRENKALSLARQRKVLSFETAAVMDKQARSLSVRLRNFSLLQSLDAQDVGEMVDTVERPNTGFDDVLGAAGAKQSLKFIVDWIRKPRHYQALGIRSPKGVLLAGPPGTGKTMLARAVAGESDCAFIEASASSFITIWQGSGPQNVRNLFDRARRYAPAVIFMDEIDAIGIKRSGGAGGGARAQEETLNAVLTEMDGFHAQSQAPVIVLAATNLPDRLDDALKRRFDRTIEVEKPDKAARQQYLEKALVQRKNSLVSAKAVERLAAQTALLTIADLERIVHQAAVVAAQKATPLDDDILAEAFDQFRMGDTRHNVDREALLRTARHEAGHALIAMQGGRIPLQLTIVGRGQAGGFMEPDRDENKGNYTKADLEHLIRQSMAGRAAEILYYGTEDGMDTGVESDLQRASQLATSMVVKWGMTECFGQLAVPSSALQQGPLADKAAQAAQAIVKAQMDEALILLERHRPALDNLVNALMEKNTLYQEDIMQLLPEAFDESTE